MIRARFRHGTEISAVSHSKRLTSVAEEEGFEPPSESPR